MGEQGGEEKGGRERELNTRNREWVVYVVFPSCSSMER